MKMFVMAGLVFAADLAAVLLIVFSLWLESWLGLSRDVVLDFIFVAATCYGVAGWIVGKLMMTEFPALPTLTKEVQQPSAHTALPRL
jgi:hypothetical protein